MSYTAKDHEKAFGLVEGGLASVMQALTEAEWKREQLRNDVNFIAERVAELKAMPGADNIHPKAWESVGIRLAMLRGQ